MACLASDPATRAERATRASRGSDEEIIVGVNLVTKVRNFSIQTTSFSSGDHDVQDGCVTPGSHKLLRFDFLSYNAGNSDMVIGSPAARPDLFVWSPAHGHYHLKDFNEFLLFTSDGSLATVGYKQAFCAIDIERISPTASVTPNFTNCNSDQGISAGWADVYSAFLACQFIVIDGVPDGDYTLQSTTNAQHVAAEDCFGDNTIWTGLRITGNTVTVIDPPYIPEDCLPFNRSQVGVIQAGGRWKVAEGGSHWMIDTGTSKSEAERIVEIINHYDLSKMCFVGRPRCDDVKPMMYWLNDSGQAPSGSLSGEDCIPFDPDNLAVVEIAGRWKVVEGSHWILDFGSGEGNAIAALHFIRKHQFDQICFVGRPDASVTYFKRSTGRVVGELIDPRVMDLLIEPPRWWEDLRAHINKVAPVTNLDEEDLGEREQPLDFDGLQIVVDAKKRKKAEIAERYGLRGLVVERAATIKLRESVEIADLVVGNLGEMVSAEAVLNNQVIAEVESSDRPRQQELLRLTAEEPFDEIRLRCENRALLVQVRLQQHPQPEKGTSEG
jgi:hypothetical protein